MTLVPLTLASSPIEKAGSASASWKCSEYSWASRASHLKHSLLGDIRACWTMKFWRRIKRRVEEAGSTFIFNTEVLQ